MPEHIPDRELSIFAQDPGSLAHGRRAETERHISICAECAATTHSYRVERGGHEAPHVGQSSAVAGSDMNAYARRCAAEDSEAEELLEPYFRNPPKAAWTLVRRRAFHTGGVVRKLNARAHAIVASTPLTALTHAHNAQAIADALPNNLYPNHAVHELRGTAWKERANALIRLGRLHAALESLQRAEGAYARLRASAHGLAAVDLVRAATYFQMGDLEEAERHERRAERAYAQLGQHRHRIKALHLRGNIQLEAGRLDTAAAVFQEVIDYGEEVADRETVAKGAYGRAYCRLDAGRLGEASTLFTRALNIFQTTGPSSDRVSTEWGVARVVLRACDPDEATQRLRDVTDAFLAIGMITDAALATLDLANALLVLGSRDEEIATVALPAVSVLNNAGVMARALEPYRDVMRRL